MSAYLRGLAVLALAGMHMAGAHAVPVSDFYREAEFEAVALSPTGEYIAASVPVSDYSALTITRLSDMKITGVFRPEKDTYIDDFAWVSDKSVIFNTARKLGRLETPYAVPGMWAMDVDGGNKKNFTDRRWTISDRTRWIISDLPDDEDHVLVQYEDRVLKTTYGRQNIYTGKLTPSGQMSPAKGAGLEGSYYIADGSGDVLLFVAGRAGTDEEVYFLRQTAADPWIKIYDEGEEKEDIEFIGFSPENRLVYFSKENKAGGPDSVIAVDARTNARTAVSRDDNVNPHSYLTSPADGSVLAIRYLDGKPRFDYLQPEDPFVKDHKRMANSFPGQDVIPMGYTKKGDKAIYYVWSDRNPGDYYLFDRATGKAAYLLSDMRWIDPDAMGETRLLKFKARDGLEIEAFLTLPKGGQSGLPLVVNPHGGPFGIFDRWGFDPDVQALASRGYAVLQVNFRGSGNYGKAFEEAGYQQWGRAMQDDLTDATRWVIQQGYADPARICIYGASYGAYAALMGAAREPGLYVCAIGYVGVYDLPRLIKDDTAGAYKKYSDAWWMKKFFTKTLGTDSQNLLSPVDMTGAIKAKVLLGGGELDQTAPIKQTKLMHEALLESGNPAQMKIYYDEGHGNFLSENRLDWANRVLDFLDANIGPESGKQTR